MNSIVLACLVNFVASAVLERASVLVARATPAERPVVVRLRLNDRRHARRWTEPLDFTVLVSNTGTKPLEFPAGVALRKDLFLCYMRAGGVFLRDLILRTTPERALEIGDPRAQLAAGATLARTFKETPLAQVPTPGLFWCWAELRARSAAEGAQRNVPRGTFRSNPILVWWQSRPIKLAAELKQIGLAIRRHQAAGVSKAAVPKPADRVLPGRVVPIPVLELAPIGGKER